MKIELAAKPDKRNMAKLKKMMMTLCQKIMTSLSFFRFVANLEQSGSRNLETWSIRLTFSLIVAF